VIGPAPEDEDVDEAVLRLVVDQDGSIAAEHGIGRAKARWLGLARSPEELAVQAAIKRALDPDGLLNPGVLDAQPVTRPLP
jgi:FAD/FMN-containing dehydrogenase